MHKNIQVLPVYVNRSFQFDSTGKPCKTVRMNKLGKRIQLARERKDLKQRELANLVGITQQSLSDIERGRSKNTRQLETFARVLGVSQAWLLGEDEKSSSLTKNSVIADRQFIPILEENDMLPWVEQGILPDNVRSIKMTELPKDPSINKKTYLKDITNDSFVNEYFKFKLPNKTLLAIIDLPSSLDANDIVIAELPDKKIKIRQYIKDGNEYFLKAFDNPAEKTAVKDTKILGVISGYMHKKFNS
jgi:transcriptional regulator with XRE-family HTH domain